MDFQKHAFKISYFYFFEIPKQTGRAQIFINFRATGFMKTRSLTNWELCASFLLEYRNKNVQCFFLLHFKSVYNTVNKKVKVTMHWQI